MGALLHGIGIGFAIAAPVGPIGMVCIRRTLHSGVGVGLASGLGAAVADAAYGLAVASGLALSGWLISHSTLLSLVGAALLIWMGVGMLRAFAAYTRASAASGAAFVPERMSKRRAFAGTFALTVTNPATIISFVGVVAALGPSAATSGAAFLLVLGVFLGSMLWWTTLVTLVRRARPVLSRSIRWVDLAAGVVLVGTGSFIALRVVSVMTLRLGAAV
jgi:threonine/homoserine/homoserine lactone efflux protein